MDPFEILLFSLMIGLQTLTLSLILQFENRITVLEQKVTYLYKILLEEGVKL